MMGKKEFEEKGAATGLMVNTKNPLWGTEKVVVTNSGFCVLEGLISMVEKGVLGLALIKKWCYWPKGVPSEEILQHMQNKEVGDVEAVQGSIRGKSYNIMTIKEPDYVVLMMITYGMLNHLGTNSPPAPLYLRCVSDPSKCSNVPYVVIINTT